VEDRATARRKGRPLKGAPELFGREKLARLAYIMGQNSAAQKALENFDERVSRGVATDCYLFCGRVIVGDPIRGLTEALAASERLP
jgi:hypothetical protein